MNVRQALEDGEGILRLAPAWVPRSFLMPGRRLKLHPGDYYALGAHRGGIDERWLASTTEAANENREPDEGLSYVVHGGERFLLRDAVAAEGERLIGKKMWEKYHRWPVYSKFFDNLGPIPHHLHQSEAQAKLVGREGKPEGYYFPTQLNNTEQAFPHTYFGLEPGTSRADVRRCLERWNVGDNGILDLSRAYRLKPGKGWLDLWVTYGRIDGDKYFSAKELTLQPGAKCTIKDDGAYGLIAVQGSGRIGSMAVSSPVMIRFGQMTEDEVFVSHEAAIRGVTFENTGSEPLVTLRYFGPEVCAGAPNVDDHRNDQ